MAQADYIVSNGTGAAVRSDINGQLAAIVSNNSGATAPATTYAYQWWADTTTNTLKLRNSANSAWIEIMQLDGTLTMEDGTEALPGLAFRDDLDTGIFRAGTNQLGISSAGVERVEFGSSEVVFNDSGANYDFRVEGDTNANLLFVDASADAVGIGTSSPGAPLNVRYDNAGTTTVALFENQRSVAGSPDAAQIVVGARTYNNTVIRQNSDQGTNAIGDTLDTVIANTYGSPGAKLILATQSTARLTVGASGNVGIGTTSVSAKLQVNQNTDSAAAFSVVSASANTTITADFASVSLQNTNTTNNNYNTIGFVNDQGGFSAGIHGIYTDHTAGAQSGAIAFATRTTGTYSEKARLTASGQWLVGTSFAATVGEPQYARLVSQGNTFNSTGDGRLSLQSGTTAASLASGNSLGKIHFAASNGAEFATIEGAVDATPGTNDHPGRLVFSTTADGASSPTERLRIASNGQLSAVVPDSSTLFPGFLARAWVNFNGTGAVAIRANGNVSSITDNGTGDYTVNFTTAMPDANYNVVASSGVNSSQVRPHTISPYTFATGSLSINAHTVDSSAPGLLADPNFANVAIFR